MDGPEEISIVQAVLRPEAADEEDETPADPIRPGFEHRVPLTIEPSEQAPAAPTSSGHTADRFEGPFDTPPPGLSPYAEGL